MEAASSLLPSLCWPRDVEKQSFAKAVRFWDGGQRSGLEQSSPPQGWNRNLQRKETSTPTQARFLYFEPESSQQASAVTHNTLRFLQSRAWSCSLGRELWGVAQGPLPPLPCPAHSQPLLPFLKSNPCLRTLRSNLFLIHRILH